MAEGGHHLRKAPIPYSPATQGARIGLVGLDLFNHDTRPSGHISRPKGARTSTVMILYAKNNLGSHTA